MLCFSAQAADLGVQGETFPITERDLLAVVRERAALGAQRGAERQAEAARKAQQSLEQMKPASHLHTATQTRRWRFIPSFQWHEDLEDAEGRVFYRAGTSINPLSKVSLNGSLVFVDGRDPTQVHWAMALPNDTGPVRIILTAGRPADLMRAHRRRLYVDQHSAMTRRLGISAVPATVAQDGNALVITEVAL